MSDITIRALETYQRICEQRADRCWHENDSRGLSGYREHKIGGRNESQWRHEAFQAELELKQLRLHC